MVKTSEMSMELKQELAFTKEELAELEAAKKMPITFDPHNVKTEKYIVLCMNEKSGYTE